MNWEKVSESAVLWGPGFVLALIVLGGLYQLIMKALYPLLDKFGTEFIKAQQTAAANLGAQAQAMEGLKASIETAVARDDNEHKEILIMLRLIWQKMTKEEESGS